MKVIDARKADCPKPVIMTREQVEAGETEIMVMVDNAVAVENVTRYLKSAGFRAEHRGEEGDYLIEARRDAAVETSANAKSDAHAARPAKGADYSYLILSDRIGAASDGLGELLMKSFLGTVVTLRPLPTVIALMNEGVRLALRDSTVAGVLRELEEAGVRVLVCGTCTKHFGVTEEVAVGSISNMFEITESVQAAAKPIVLG